MGREPSDEGAVERERDHREDCVGVWEPQDGKGDQRRWECQAKPEVSAHEIAPLATHCCESLEHDGDREADHAAHDRRSRHTSTHRLGWYLSRHR